MLRLALVAAAALSAATLAACDRSSSAEKAGEHVDSAIEDATQGHANSGDGVFEKAGESVDRATGHNDTDPVDAVHDATDGNKSTHP